MTTSTTRTSSSSSSSSKSTAALLTGVCVAAAAAAGVCYYVITKRNETKANQRRGTVEDIRGNFYATGSDVVRIYNNKSISRAIESKTFLITGTTSGLGRQVAYLLGTNGGHVIMGIRRPAAGAELQQEIETAGGRADIFELDLASLDSVRSFASQVIAFLKENNKKLDVLINNAGIFCETGATKDGYQKVWQVNAMAPALLTDLLLPILADDNGRVVNVSSEIHRMLFYGGIASRCPPDPQTGSSAYDYALSKACQIIHAHELMVHFTSLYNNNNNNNNNTVEQQRRRRRAFAIEPGLVVTKIDRNVPGWIRWIHHGLFGPLAMRTLDQGCSTILFCALAPHEDLNGQTNTYNNTDIKPTPTTTIEHYPYFFSNCAPCSPSRIAGRVEETKALSELFRSIWKQSQKKEIKKKANRSNRIHDTKYK